MEREGWGQAGRLHFLLSAPLRAPARAPPRVQPHIFLATDLSKLFNAGIFNLSCRVCTGGAGAPVGIRQLPAGSLIPATAPAPQPRHPAFSLLNLACQRCLQPL